VPHAPAQPAPEPPLPRVVPATPPVNTASLSSPEPATPAPEPSYRAPSIPSATVPPYARLLDEAVGAIGARQMDAAANLVEQMIRTEPARGEGWALRGLLAMQVYGNLPVAYQSYANALARGSKAGFRVVHDHGPDRPPCVGALELTAASLDFKADDGGHRFSWPLGTIRESAINAVYGSAFGMFHIKAQTPGAGDTFNFVVVRATDAQVVNRRPDAQMIVQLLNNQRASAMR
jgi:hypothetical protein